MVYELGTNSRGGGVLFMAREDRRTDKKTKAEMLKGGTGRWRWEGAII